jgi:hypothetical protein
MAVNFLMILKYIAAAGTALTGLLALVQPLSAVGFTGLSPQGGRGVTELRAIFGGLFIALGVTPFFLGRPAFVMLGIGYLAIAAVRLVSIFLDKSSVSSNWISLAVEIVFGVILVL